MKTNQLLLSTDRILFGVNIRQETKTSFLSITDLQKSYDKARWQYGWKEKRIANILQNASTIERIYYLLKDRDIVKTGFTAFMEMIEINKVTKVLKGLGVWQTKGRADNKRVQCDPYIWVLIAMELNPMIYAKVITWLTDSLVFDRIDAGSQYRPMNHAISKTIKSPNYPMYARAINEKVFGKHITGMRNLASSSELREITKIENRVIDLIKFGAIKDSIQILKAIKMN